VSNLQNPRCCLRCLSVIQARQHTPILFCTHHHHSITAKNKPAAVETPKQHEEPPASASASASAVESPKKAAASSAEGKKDPIAGDNATEGTVLARISVRTLIVKEWKETFWIVAGGKLLLYRSKEDYLYVRLVCVPLPLSLSLSLSLSVCVCLFVAACIAYAWMWMDIGRRLKAPPHTNPNPPLTHRTHIAHRTPWA
jgi:hypothetical protein